MSACSYMYNHYFRLSTAVMKYFRNNSRAVLLFIYFHCVFLRFVFRDVGVLDWWFFFGFV
jgi:hypothetical protein